MVRFRARVLYDGTTFSGSQKQPCGGAVANVLEAALFKRMQQHVTVHSASRTDAGVHARGQAVHFDLDRSSGTLDGTALARSINALCPHAVRVTDVEEDQKFSTV